MRVLVSEIVPPECGGGVVLSFRKGKDFNRVYERYKPKNVGEFVPVKESVNDREIHVRYIRK